MFSSMYSFVYLLLLLPTVHNKVKIIEVSSVSTTSAETLCNSLDHGETTREREDAITRHEKYNQTKAHAIRWTTCSASCGEGIQSRICDKEPGHCRVSETRPCFLQFCPSYLTGPRIHFFGDFTADVSTLNNIRCNFVNARFSRAVMKENMPILTKKGYGYTTETSTWNPDGSGRFHLNAKVTSFCNNARNCSTDDAIVGKTMKETSVVAIVDIDPDWQLASEIYGMRIEIQGVMRAKFERTAVQQPKPRGNFLMSKLKSKLTDIAWLNVEKQREFRNASSLSITLVIDQFVESTRLGRISGTIGLTSDDDPLGTEAGRKMFPAGEWRMKGGAPFYIDTSRKVITLDLSGAFNCTATEGQFNITALGDLDLALEVPNQPCSRQISATTICYVTKHGMLSKRLDDNDIWYNAFGGVIEIDLNHLPDYVITLMTSHKLVIIQKKLGHSAPRIILSETMGGINIGFTQTHVERMNPGETMTRTAFISSFGKPVKGAELEMNVVVDSVADTECGWAICDGTLGEPRDALRMIATGKTNNKGLITFKIHAGDPGNIRGCGLDGQIFPTELRLRRNGAVYVEGGLNRQVSNAGKNYDFYLATLPSVIAVYSEVPVIECPTWQDVKPIFILYRNLYPVMWKHNIIDMSSYANIMQRKRLLQYAMFELDFDDPRYMPISRDLSKSKLKLIKNWMDCGMKERNEPDYPTCNVKEVAKRVTELRELVQRAVTLELTIIPPYYTAWLSMQTEYGRNMKTANIVKNVFIDEMLHMSLAANILNSIGGKVNLSTYSNVPHYPTYVGFGETYNLASDLMITLGPMSRGIAHDVFMRIEEPGDHEQRQILNKVAKLLELVGSTTSSTKQFSSGHQSSKSSHIKNDENTKNQSKMGDTNSDEAQKSPQPDWEEISRFTSKAIYDLSNTNITSIGAFYTAIALNMAFIESCYHQGEDISNTLFTGNLSHQLSMDHWHKPEDYYLQNMQSEDLELPVFEVKDLKTALQAIVAIIFEGEGGTNCSPYLAEGENSEDLPHYYRFMEIVNGRELRRVHDPATWEMTSCMKIDHDCDVAHDVTNKTMFCFTGDTVPFHDDGVWPLITNPDESMYPDGSAVKRHNKEFNVLYTRLLQCLETAFGGHPDHVKSCMQEMHYLRIVGKKVVQTPVFKNGIRIGHGTPTWEYVRREDETAGLPVILPQDELY